MDPPIYKGGLVSCLGYGYLVICGSRASPATIDIIINRTAGDSYLVAVGCTTLTIGITSIDNPIYKGGLVSYLGYSYLVLRGIRESPATIDIIIKRTAGDSYLVPVGSTSFIIGLTTNDLPVYIGSLFISLGYGYLVLRGTRVSPATIDTIVYGTAGDFNSVAVGITFWGRTSKDAPTYKGGSVIGLGYGYLVLRGTRFSPATIDSPAYCTAGDSYLVAVGSSIF